MKPPANGSFILIPSSIQPPTPRRVFSKVGEVGCIEFCPPRFCSIFFRKTAATLLIFTLLVGKDLWVFLSSLSDCSVFAPSDKCLKILRSLGKSRQYRGILTNWQGKGAPSWGLSLPKIPARKGLCIQNRCSFLVNFTLDYANCTLNYANFTLNYTNFTLIFPKGPKIEKIQSRLKFSISLEVFNLD